MAANDKTSLYAGLTATFVVSVGVALGSGNLLHYDPALLIYTFGSLVSVFVITYRVTAFYQRPPSRLYALRALQRLLRLRGWATVSKQGATDVGAQRFIFRRNKLRWIAHLLFSWGTLIACAITIPLVFGWMHFETPAGDLNRYDVIVFGQNVHSFHIESLTSFLVFNMLNISAVMVIVGVSIALHRRLYAPGRSRSRQQFGRDFVPLLMLLAISITGLMLTYSMHAMDGYGYSELSLVHALVVIVAMIYIPFGKFFHVFVRPLHLAVGLYRREDAKQDLVKCQICSSEFAGQMHVADLKKILRETGMNWTFDDGPVAHYADVCPSCRRRSMGATHHNLAQAKKLN
jgi:hypothetical protein